MDRKYSNQSSETARIKRILGKYPADYTPLPVQVMGNPAETKRVNANNRLTARAQAFAKTKSDSRARDELKYARAGTLADVTPGTRMSRIIRAAAESDVARRNRNQRYLQGPQNGRS